MFLNTNYFHLARIIMNNKNMDRGGSILISTFSDEASLITLSRLLIVEKKLCACVNYTKVNSIYMWDSSLQHEQEYIAFFKTSNNCIDDLKMEIKKNHKYEIPEIIVLDMNDVSNDYLSWIISVTSSNKKLN